MSELVRTLEALLFLSPEPVAAGDLADACAADPEEIEEALGELAELFAPGPRGRGLGGVAGGWTLSSAPETEAAARRLLAKPRTPPLTPAHAVTPGAVAHLHTPPRPPLTR